MSDKREQSCGRPMKRIALIGGTFSGNKGAAGMLESVIRNLRHHLPDRIWFDVLSLYPSRDRERALPDGVRIVGAPAWKLVLLLPSLAALYTLLGRLRLPRRFLLAFRPLEAIARSSMLVDISGISYVDGRTATLMYNLSCNLPALLVGAPLVKMSQAIGPLQTPVNRIAGRFVLKRAKRVFARGRETQAHLARLGLENVSLAADLAFVLNDIEPVPELPAFVSRRIQTDGPVIGVVPSRVLDDHCRRRGVDLAGILAPMLDSLHERTGAHIVVIAHSLLESGRRSRNNDSHICADLCARMRCAHATALVLEDLGPSELRAVIARCDILIAARFHAMISALCVGVPPLVIAWSHKYREVMTDFGLERHVVELVDLGAEKLLEATVRLLEEREEIRAAIASRLPAVQDSARSQIEFLLECIENCEQKPLQAGATARRLYRRFYQGQFMVARLGYSAHPDVRGEAASGGLVSSVLISELRARRITGAIACRTVIERGLDFKTVLCTGEKDVLDCRTSIYSDFDHARSVIELLRNNDGVFAVVALPCQWRVIERFLQRRPELSGRLGLRLGLWCGHATDRRLIDDFLRIRGIDAADIARLRYRVGHWRGETIVEMRDGSANRFSFQKGYGLLQNLYVDCSMRCLSCADHFSRFADVSFGDAWLAELKNAPIKHSLAVALTERGKRALEDLTVAPDAHLVEVAPELIVESQKRAVIWHTYGAAARGRVGRLFGYRLPERSDVAPRWNDFVSAVLILAARKAYSSPLREVLMRLPWPLPFAYMLAQKYFLNF